tara:strand:+ start:3877 stop:4539 length:663 start_codon:yes stop_codon:yes gene_type:complete
MKWDLKNLGEGLARFVVGTEGNISKRTSEGFRIKASGFSLKYMNKDSYVACSIDGTPIEGEVNKPSMEWSFHSWIYQNSNYRIIAHTHPTNILKILCTDNLVQEFAAKRLFPDQVVFNGVESCVVPYATPGIELTLEIEKAVREYEARLGEFPKLLLLKNHGIICCANTVKEAIIMTEICEKAAEIFMGANTLHSIDYLTKDEVKSVLNHEDEKYRKELV